MLITKLKKTLLTSGIMLVTACAATANSDNSRLQPTAAPPVIAQMANTSEPKGITLEKIMSDTDWLGRQPGRGFWADDSQAVYYSRKREGSAVSDFWQISMENAGDSNGELVEMSELHLLNNDRVYSQDKTKTAWVYENSVFVKSLASGEVKQLTGQLGVPYNLKFTNDDNIIYSDAGAVYHIDLATGLVSELLRWHFAKQPEALKDPKDY